MNTKIIKIRKQLHLSQEQLARELGVSFTTVNRWEKGKTKPSPLATKALQFLLKEERKRDGSILK